MNENIFYFYCKLLFYNFVTIIYIFLYYNIYSKNIYYYPNENNNLILMNQKKIESTLFVINYIIFLMNCILFFKLSNLEIIN